MSMKTNSPQSLDQLIHDINSKCGSLKGAAGLLRNASHEETKEILELMAKEAEVLARVIAEFNENNDRKS